MLLPKNLTIFFGDFDSQCVDDDVDESVFADFEFPAISIGFSDLRFVIRFES